VLLVSMPFGALERQALGLSLLKPCLERRGLACDIQYLNFPFAEFTGLEDYCWLNYEAPYTAFAGDWIFTEALYGARPKADLAYKQDVLRGTWRMKESDIERLERMRAVAEPFLQHCLAFIDWERYGMVGFTSTFEQNIASLALARRLKQRYRKMRIVCGGANWEGEMGLELHRQFEFVDYVCCGEAEMSFPSLVSAVARGGRSSEIRNIPGVVFRYNGESVSTGTGDRVRSMDDLPVPDYTDYFEQWQGCAAAVEVVPHLLLETSRGCWWGAKSHCTFCGLNGGSMTFRGKSAGRALAELRDMRLRWRAQMVEVVDNILDMSYFHDFLPALAAERAEVSLFYEVKANLTRAQLRLLRDAGVNRIQPGIESLSNHVLQLIRKGTTGLQNVQLLKWSREYGVHCEWNLLYGFPGETREDYARLLELLKQLRHLSPPVACGPLRLDRFSPYHNAPEQHGLRNVRPMAAYRYLYPFGQETLKRIAYYFDYDYAPQVDPRGFADEVVRYCAQWQQSAESGGLTMVRKPDGRLGVLDTRGGARQALELSGLEQAAYEFCDSAHSAAAVTRLLRRDYPQAAPGENEVTGFLESAVARRLMVRDEGQYLSLAQAAGPLRLELESRRAEPVRTGLELAPLAGLRYQAGAG
jgi:ribosomal peptide maturation radical SAM protein 1